MADIPPGTIVSVAPGKIGAILFTLAIGGTYPLAFVPNLAVAQRLRRRRLDLPGGPNWRPTSLFDFAVWQQGEKTSVVAAIQAAADQLEGFAANKALHYSSNFGEEGTAEALLGGLRQADLVRLACHGRIDDDALGAELLVAANGSLPPSIVTISPDGHAANHLVSWRRLAGLANISPLVLSGACSSGFAILRSAGERLGVERPLFAAGAVAYLAPQWPVSMEQIQKLNVAIAQAYISATATPLSLVVWEQINGAAGQMLSPLTRAAVGLFGDWL
jgi:hypothetical protein